MAGQQPTESARGGRVPAHTILGERYSITAFVRGTSTAEIYAAGDLQGEGQVHVHIVHLELAASPDLRQVVMDEARKAISVRHPNIIDTLDTGFDGQYCYVVTEMVEASSLRDLLAQRAASGQAGLGAKGVINLMDAMCSALGIAHEAGVYHGRLSADGVYVDGDGTVRVSGFGLGALAAAAIQENLLDKPREVAPETARIGEPSPQADVFGVGMLFYELLIGRPLERGGPRPSQAVQGLSTEMDRLMAVSVGVQPDSRPTLAEFQARLSTAFAPPPSVSSPNLGGPISHHSISSAAIDLAVLADSSEKWLVSKGRMDYGPFSLSEVVEQIRSNQILPGHVVINNDTGVRCNVEDHEILGAIVDKAKEARDDARRADAEEVVAKQETRRGATLYLFIAAGVAALGVIAYFMITKASEQEDTKSAGVSAVAGGEFTAKITFQKSKKRTTRRSGKKKTATKNGTSAGGGEDDVVALDMSDDVGSERLDDDVINGVIQGKGGQLGRCLQSNGGGYAKITFSIAGKTGKAAGVKVNGSTSGGLYSCVNKVVRSMKFPTFDGARTRAEFDMEL